MQRRGKLGGRLKRTRLTLETRRGPIPQKWLLIPHEYNLYRLGWAGGSWPKSRPARTLSLPTVLQFNQLGLSAGHFAPLLLKRSKVPSLWLVLQILLAIPSVIKAAVELTTAIKSLPKDEQVEAHDHLRGIVKAVAAQSAEPMQIASRLEALLARLG